MKTISIILSILSITIFLFSCRQIIKDEELEDENISFNSRSVSVKFDVQGIEWNNINGYSLVSENNLEEGSEYIKNTNLNTYTESLGEGLEFVEIEEISDIPVNSKYIASLGLSSKLVEKYPYDVMTVLVYKKLGNKYVFDNVLHLRNDYKFELTGGQNYTLFLLGGKITDIRNKENINEVYFDVTNLNYTLYVQRIDNIVPSGDKTNVLDVKLKYPGTHVTLIFDSTDTFGGNAGKEITLIDSVGYENEESKSTPYRYYLNKGMIDFFEKKLAKKREITDKNSGKLIISYDFGYTLRRSLDYTVFFKTVDMFENRTITIPMRNLKPGHKQVFKVKLKRCGAYLGPNKTNWHQFMCHNLGANYSKPPFTLSGDIIGDKYQWGHNRPILKQGDTSIPYYWNRSFVEADYSWDYGRNDPCPTGYRVPTKEEWANVIRYNAITKIGSWPSSGPGENYLAGVMIGKNLMLPTAGVRNEYGQPESGKGPVASYWSGTNSGYVNNGRGYFFALEFKLGIEGIIGRRDFADGLSVRCIRK